jgi:hypothetical protein
MRECKRGGREEGREEGREGESDSGWVGSEENDMSQSK